MDIKHIMLVLDAETDDQALIDKASVLAKRFNSQIEVAMYVYSQPLAASHLFDSKGLSEVQEVYLGQQREYAEAFTKKLQDLGIKVSIHVEWAKHAYAAIVERATLQEFDLILKSVRKHSMIDRTLMTHMDWHLMRETPIPLLFVRGKEWGGHINVAAAVDPMHTEEKSTVLDNKILSAAHDLACKLPAELHVAHAFEPLATGVIIEFDSVISNYDEYREAVRAKHKEALDNLLKHSTESSCKVHFEEGAPEIVVPQLANREDIDVIVLGAVARTGLDRIIIGSTAERLLDNLDCDMLILRSDSSLGMID